MIVNSPQYPIFLEHMIKHFIRILVDGEPYFIAEYHIFVSYIFIRSIKIIISIIYVLFYRITNINYVHYKQFFIIIN